MPQSVRMCSVLVASLILIAIPAIADDPRVPEVLVTSDASGTTLSIEGEGAFHTTTARVTGQRLIGIPGTATRVAVWNEFGADGDSTSFFSVGRDGDSMSRARRTSYVLKLRHGDFDPQLRIPSVDSTLTAGPETSVHIVQLITQPLVEYKDAIESEGAAVLGFLADNSYIVRIPADARERLAGLPFVRWVGAYHPAYRLEEFLREGKANAQELFPLQRYNILVFDTGDGPDEAKSDVARRIEGFGGTVDSADAGKFLLVATLTPEQLFEVVRWDEVKFIDRWSPLEPDMDIVREMGGANYLETVTGYTGQGVRAEIFDDGFDLNHPDFQSRPLIVHGGSVSTNSHGTATAGITVGDGSGDAKARGLMPDAQGIVADYDNVGLTGTTRYDHAGELLQDPYFAVYQTASVGSTRTTEYTTISADHDTMLFDWDIVHCQSQSNAGNQNSRPQAWAKNVVSGGAFNHYNTLTKSDDCWCSTGSIGPASDGRIKPDLSFFYDDTYTSYSTSGGYGEFGGTSGATPSICGYFGLFFQMWSEGIFGNEVDPLGTVFDNRPHMTTAKAFMINTAEQYPFSGTADDMTRTHQGWGVPSAQRLYDLRENISFIDESVLLANMESVEFNALVDPGEPALKITMTYADPAGNPASSQHRINDLTLKVTSPSAVVYWGNNGLLEGNWSQPGGSADTIDTVENVFVENPEAGSWIIEVIASEVNEDGHVETPEIDADFALVTSGAFVSSCTSDGRISLDRSVYSCEDEASLRVVDCDLNLDDLVVETVTVTVSSESEPGGETVVLTETAPDTATFTGALPLSGSDAPGVLLVAHGNTVTSTYIDADNGEGGFDISKTDTAPVDCVPPLISNVATTDIEPRSARVTFDTDEAARGDVRWGTSCGALTGTAGEVGFGTAHSITLTGLTDNTTYFYAVDAEDQARNQSSDDNGGACYSFITPEIPDFFTELFGSDNDLDNVRLTFTPNGSVDYYELCSDPITSFPTDPSGGTTLTLADDSFETVTLTGGTTVSLYGVDYSTFYVGSNGYITFNSGNTTTGESFANHFNQPRISALFDDLNPASAGTVSWKQLPDRIVVTWDAVTEYGSTNSNSFQIDMYFNGTIAISFLDIAATDGLAGLSEGNGVSPDFLETDLSAAASCGAETCFDGVLNQGEERIDCGGPCSPCECLSNAVCDDGQFCTGANVCDDYGRCRPGPDPCPGQACDEDFDRCVECVVNDDCDDGVFCNGIEECLPGNVCDSGLEPCPYQACDEGGDVCLACDGDGICEPGEDCANCASDCISGTEPVCGNGICEVADGENCLTCELDCNGAQSGKPADRYCCGDGVTGENPVTCADARCNAGGNTCSSAPVLAYCCGDATCENIETEGNCQADCHPTVPGEAGADPMLLVTGYDPATGAISINFGVPCAAADHTIEYGELTHESLSAYAWAGQECGIGMSGTHQWTPAGAPQSLFFVVVSNNGAEEGSYGTNHRGFERPADTSSLTCPMTQNLQYSCQ